MSRHSLSAAVLALTAIAFAVAGGSAALAPGQQPPANSSPPTLDGSAIEGQTLKASTGTWSGPRATFSYQWQRCSSIGSSCVPVEDATLPTYILGTVDVDHTMRVIVEATSKNGATSATSDATALVALAPTIGTTFAVSESVTDGTTLSGAVTWTAAHTGGAAVSRIEFSVDGSVKWTDSASPYQFGGDPNGVLDTKTLANGGHTLAVKAMAVDGSVAATSSSVTVDNATATTTASPIYWGAYIDGNDTYGGSYGDAPWDYSTWDLFEKHAGKKVSLLHFGQPPPWEHGFEPTAFNLTVARGAIPLVDMSSKGAILTDIVAGRYDGEIKAWMQDVKNWGHPFFLRWNWEMNGTWFPWGAQAKTSPAAFVASWRHMHDLAVQTGATNITWVWCPNLDFSTSTDLGALYPGDAYVDWTGLDGYNQGTNSQSFSSLFTPSYNHLLQVAPAKPIMVAETSSYEFEGAKAQWITDTLASLPSAFPKIRALVWFNWRITENGVVKQWQTESSSSSQAAFAAGIASSYYGPNGVASVSGSPIQPLGDGSPTTSTSTTTTSTTTTSTATPSSAPTSSTSPSSAPSASFVLSIMKYTRTAAWIQWPAMPGATGYRLYKDGTLVSSAGSGATNAKFGQLAEREHIFRVQATGISADDSITVRPQWEEVP